MIGQPVDDRSPGGCPVVEFDRAGEGYAVQVAEWLANPHAYFRAFGREAREFQRAHRSERLRTMTLVAPAEELAALRPVCICVDSAEERVDSWTGVFATVAARLIVAHPAAFVALQEAGELAWMGCPPGGAPVAEVLESGDLRPEFGSVGEVVLRVQWMFIVCGIRLNEAIVQVDPYTDEQWAVRREELRQKRAEERTFMEGRRAAQRAWAAEHPDGTPF